MIQLTDKLYFSSINFNGYATDFWNNMYAETSEGGRFAIDMGRRLNPYRHMTRNDSIWTNPWPQPIIPKYAMVDYDPTFKLNFAEVSDLKAQQFAKRIRETNEKFAIMYSGGIDSSTIMIALIKNLTSEELKNISVCTSAVALVENPTLWKNHIYGKFEIIDSASVKYSDLIATGYTPVTADDGDCLFGTVFGLSIYYNWQCLIEKYNLSPRAKTFIANNIHRFSDPDLHYSYFKDLLIGYLNLQEGGRYPNIIVNPDPNFGRRLYDKFDLNCKTAGLPISSLHDFFWWLIFNVKMLNCSVRGALYYNDVVDPNTAIHAIENWYNDSLYQHWSMNNNNNGQKILGGPATYKKAARDYIYSFDKNEWYRSFKLKLESMANLALPQAWDLNLPNGRPTARFGITTDYKLLSIDDTSVQEYIRHHLNNYQLDWTE